MDWLPKELSLDSRDINEDYSRLYEIFKKDFVESKVYFRGELVVFQDAHDATAPTGQYPHGFTHLITRKNAGQRIIDYNRAVRLPWIREIIEHCDDSSVVIINRKQLNKRYGITDNTYLWLQEKDFVVILRKIPKGRYCGQMLVTAYATTDRYMKKKLEKYLAESKQTNK